jgi:hypothetical protein
MTRRLKVLDINMQASLLQNSLNFNKKVSLNKPFVIVFLIFRLKALLFDNFAEKKLLTKGLLLGHFVNLMLHQLASFST